MDRTEELEEIATWLGEEGLSSDSPKEAQLCFLWRVLQRTRSRLSNVTRDLETHRSQHSAEMAEVRKSLEQIRFFTEHKDVLAQEIQDENDELQDQLRRLISLQDAQISEVAKMLYQQGLTELIHSSPSEQVAYLLVERASLLEASEVPDVLARDGNTAGLLGTEARASNPSVCQAEAKHLAGQASGLEWKCSRLERDLEEGSRRLAMAHNEIRRLTDELESAHLTRRAYEPELQSAQQEVEQLGQEVEKLKKYEMVELRKVKELNDRLDLEIRALRTRVRSLDAEKSSLKQTVVSLQEQLDSALQQQTGQTQSNQATERAQVESLQKKAELLESDLQEQQQQILVVQLQANENEALAKALSAELAQSKQTCSNLRDKLSAQRRQLLENKETAESLQKEVERLQSVLQERQQQLVTVQLQAEELAKIHSQQQLDNSHNHLCNLGAKICTKENNLQDQEMWKQEQGESQLCGNSHSRLEDLFTTEDKELQTEPYTENTRLEPSAPGHQEYPDHQEAMKTLLSAQDECETLKKEICETLQCLDTERSKYHKMKEKHKAKLCHVKQKFDEETEWRDEKIKGLDRELSLCSHSLTKEKELVMSITVENEKLLCERRRLLQQLNEEEYNKKDSNLTASLSRSRVDYLEMENKKLRNTIFHMSKQRAVAGRSLHNMQPLHFTEDLKKMFQSFASLPVQTSSVLSPEQCEIQDLSDSSHRSHTKQTDVTSSSHCLASGALYGSAEMGYLNLTSTQRHTDTSLPPAVLSNSESTTS